MKLACFLNTRFSSLSVFPASPPFFLGPPSAGRVPAGPPPQGPWGKVGSSGDIVLLTRRVAWSWEAGGRGGGGGGGRRCRGYDGLGGVGGGLQPGGKGGGWKPGTSRVTADPVTSQLPFGVLLFTLGPGERYTHIPILLSRSLAM